MTNFIPFGGIYPSRYYNYYNFYKNNNSDLKNINLNPNNPETENKNININTNKKKTSRYNINFSNLFSNDLENPIIEILGIQLYLDDLIILGLLFFLYQENIHDEILFFILILLLLS